MLAGFLLRPRVDADPRPSPSLPFIPHSQVSELESLVESKIYREDELETELEKYKSLARTKVSSESSSASVLSKSRTNGTTTSRDEDEGGECEMCGQMGHDLDDCPICESGSACVVTTPTPS